MIVTSFTPGPGNILAMEAAASLGLKRALPTVAGVCLGYLAVQYLCTAAVCLAGLAIEGVLELLKYVGVVYILWLAWHIWRSEPGESGSGSAPSFWKAFFLQFVNVKIYLYMITLLVSHIIPAGTGLVWLAVAGLGVVSVGTVANFLWAAAGSRLQDAYASHFTAVNAVLALSLVACAVDVALS